MAHLKGLILLAHLLGRPGSAVRALDLVRLIHPADPSAVKPREADDAGLRETSSAAVRQRRKERQAQLGRTQASYLDQYRALEKQLHQAREDGDAGKVTEIEQQMDFLTDKIKRGRNEARRACDSSDPDEQARLSVRDNISRAVERIADVHPPLAAHLRASISYGYSLIYAPEDPSVSWHLSVRQPT